MNTRLIGSACALVLVWSVGAKAAEIILQPVSASGAHTIVGTEIRLEGAGQRVRLEVKIKDFAPELLKVFQASLDSRGYSNTGLVRLHPAIVDCPSRDNTGHEFCRSAFGETGIGAPRCDYRRGIPSNGLSCEAGWINQSRTDWLLFGRNSLPAVDLVSAGFRWGAATYPGEEGVDEGLTYYAGTLMVDVPAGAVGSFTIGWFDQPLGMSFMQNENHFDIKPLIVTSARITILCANDAQCDDQSNCTLEQCNLATSECEFTSVNEGLKCDDGNACTTGDQCNLGKCVPQTTVACNNFDQCNYAGTCNPDTGICSAPAPMPDGSICIDNDPCRVSDRCLQGVCVSGTQFSPNGIICNDGNPCSLGDRCVSGSCLPQSQQVCFNGNDCNNPGTCDPTSGHCGAPIPKPYGTSCSDGNPCTLDDACSQGTCLSGPLRNCSGQTCRAATCNIFSGQCQILPNGTTCTDENLCTFGDRCLSGHCMPVSSIQCEGDSCNNPGSCNPQTGVCSLMPKPDGTVCHDGDLCTVSYCEDGVCDIETVLDCIEWHDFFECIEGPQSPTATECDPYDLNSDGVVDLLDAAILIPRY